MPPRIPGLGRVLTWMPAASNDGRGAWPRTGIDTNATTPTARNICLMMVDSTGGKTNAAAELFCAKALCWLKRMRPHVSGRAQEPILLVVRYCTPNALVSSTSHGVRAPHGGGFASSGGQRTGPADVRHRLCEDEQE